MKKRVYLSGPMSGIPEKNKAEFCKAQAHYMSEGFFVINPHEIGETMYFVMTRTHGKEPIERYYIAEDLQYLGHCDMMVLLPGWENSKGCNIEIAFATQYDIPIYQAYTERKMNFSTQIINKVESLQIAK